MLPRSRSSESAAVSESPLARPRRETILYLAVILAWLVLPGLDAFARPKEEPGVVAAVAALVVGVALGTWAVMSSRVDWKRLFEPEAAGLTRLRTEQRPVYHLSIRRPNEHKAPRSPPRTPRSACGHDTLTTPATLVEGRIDAIGAAGSSCRSQDHRRGSAEPVYRRDLPGGLLHEYRRACGGRALRLP